MQNKLIMISYHTATSLGHLPHRDLSVYTPTSVPKHVTKVLCLQQNHPGRNTASLLNVSSAWEYRENLRTRKKHVENKSRVNTKPITKGKEIHQW